MLKINLMVTIRETGRVILTLLIRWNKAASIISIQVTCTESVARYFGDDV